MKAALKMKTMKNLITAALLISFNTMFAHALWIETKTSAKIGQVHEVKVFLGEYAKNERDSTQHWFSNMDEFSLWLIAPDGKKSPLSCAPNGTHFKTSFTPNMSGTYTLTIDHTVKEVYGGSKIRYYAIGLVAVDSPININNLTSNIDFMLLTTLNTKHKVNTSEKVQLQHKGLPRSGSLAVQSPEGWEKSFHVDKSGVVSFIPMWFGLYLLEGSFTEDGDGQHEGKEYKRIWHCVTYCLPVEK